MAQVRVGVRSSQVKSRDRGAVVVPIPETARMPPTIDGLVVFRSRYRRARVQLTAAVPKMDPDGRFVHEPALYLQFDNHSAIVPTKGPDAAKGKRLVELAKQHKHFGLKNGGTFWLAEEELGQLKKAKQQEAIDFLQNADQETLAHVLQALGGKSFPLPEKTEDDGKEEEPPAESDELENADLTTELESVNLN